MGSSDLERARAVLGSGGYTCVLCRDGVMLTSTERGVRPLLRWLDDGEGVQGFSAADKVVGRAAAFLYVLLGVKEVYAGVMSEGAADVLSAHGIPFECGVLAEKIINRRGDGICPMERAVTGIVLPEEAMRAVRDMCKTLNIL